MLLKQISRASEMGFDIKTGSEIELYVFNETYESAAEKNYHNLKTACSYIEDYQISKSTKEESLIGAIRRALEGSGIPVEFSKGEWGPGQQEVNLRYSDALSQCDANVIYKHAAKEIAFEQGKAVTFMAKWDEGSGRFQYAHPLLPCRSSHRSKPLPRATALWAGNGERHLQMVSWRMDGHGI